MHEFKSDKNSFFRKTLRRVIFEVFILLLLSSFFWSSWSKALPAWLEVSVLIILSAYIIFGLVYYPKAKAIAGNFSICLLDKALGFPEQGSIRQIPYSDLSISKVKKKNDNVVEIWLKTTFNQTIKLQGLENMEELNKGLFKRIKNS